MANITLFSPLHHPPPIFTNFMRELLLFDLPHGISGNRENVFLPSHKLDRHLACTNLGTHTGCTMEIQKGELCLHLLLLSRKPVLVKKDGGNADIDYLALRLSKILLCGFSDLLYMRLLFFFFDVISYGNWNCIWEIY